MSEIFKNGRASISLGYIGIHETINALFGGEHLYDGEQLRAKGIAIVERLRRAKLWISGKTRPATALACTARQVKTSVTAAVWIPPSSAWCRA
ncbi:hypothetical protein KCP69_26210 [Salmonella enterica subsp. enterica]|nr:hypothetical protein KCP69_26210 [Salmonella enterica subsp. enterica]